MYVLVALLVANCSGNGPTPDDNQSEGSSSEAASDLRGALSAAMATGQILDYSETWQVVSDGASAGAGKIRLFYTRLVIPEGQRASGADQSEVDYWNREHIWPVSYGLDGTVARSDVHNIVPTDRTVNADRGNLYFDHATTPQRECDQCSESDVAFEPPVEVRGDVARIAFYMDVRYEGTAGDGVPDLTLSDTPDVLAARFGRLSTLIRWHCDYPVSSEEVQRHEAVALAQGKRNAFIDSPELSGDVFGFACE